MKKLNEFIMKYGLLLFLLFVVIAAVGCVFLPLFVAIARVAWDVAINNPSAMI